MTEQSQKTTGTISDCFVSWAKQGCWHVVARHDLLAFGSNWVQERLFFLCGRRGGCEMHYHSINTLRLSKRKMCVRCRRMLERGEGMVQWDDING